MTRFRYRLPMILLRMQVLLSIIGVILVSVAPWAATQTLPGSDNTPVEISLTETSAEEPTVVEPPPEPSPTVTPPSEPVPIPTDPVLLEPTPEPGPTAEPLPVETEPPIGAEPEPTTIIETEPVIVPAPTQSAPRTPLPTVEPSPSPDPDLGPSATSVPIATVSPAPTVVPTSTPSLTLIPTPRAISWSQPDPASCTVVTGDAESLPLGESVTWRCVSTIVTTSTGELPDDFTVKWVLRASYGGDVVSIHVLAEYGAILDAPDSLPAANEAYVRASAPWAEGGVQTIAFEVMATRTSCALGSAELRLTADPVVESVSSHVQVTRTDEAGNPAVMATVSAAGNGEPIVRFDGPLTFESLTGTADGLISQISRGTAVITVEGDWNPCTTWTLSFTGTVEVPAATPGEISVVSINEVPLPGEACIPGAACDVIVLPPSGSQASPLRYTIGLELQLHELTPAGEFGISLHADLSGAKSQPRSRGSSINAYTKGVV